MIPAELPLEDQRELYDFYLELRPPGSSDLVPSAYVHARGGTRDEAEATVRVPGGWAVYVKRQKLIEHRTCQCCGSGEEVKHRWKNGHGWWVRLECTHAQCDDEY